MYAYTVGSLSHEEDKWNVVSFFELSARGAEKSSKTKHGTQLDPEYCILKSHLTFLEVSRNHSFEIQNDNAFRQRSQKTNASKNEISSLNTIGHHVH